MYRCAIDAAAYTRGTGLQGVVRCGVQKHLYMETQSAYAIPVGMESDCLTDKQTDVPKNAEAEAETDRGSKAKKRKA